MHKIIGVLVVAAVMLAIATVSWAAVGSSGPPPGLKSINSHPIGTVGSGTEGQAGMPILSQP